LYTTKRKIPTGDFLAGSSPLLLYSKPAFYNRLLLVVAALGGLLYGVDLGIIAGALPYLEATSDMNAGHEYFECPSHASRQGRWNIYGLFLPDEVLRRVYRENALRLLH
jgi:hypothetical protein